MFATSAPASGAAVVSAAVVSAAASVVVSPAAAVVGASVGLLPPPQATSDNAMEHARATLNAFFIFNSSLIVLLTLVVFA